jgi:hypothetical protein
MNNVNKKVDSKTNKFLKLNPENENLNQYWFSESTIQFFTYQIEKYSNQSEKIAFISTPSLFFTVNSEIQNKSYLFDYDEKLIKKHKNCIWFDFNWTDFSSITTNHAKSFDYIIIDPPYINEEAWSKYANFVNLIATDNAKILTCSIKENNQMLKKLLNLDVKKYQPSIPHLVYQYNIYANYDDEELDKINPEIID